MKVFISWSGARSRIVAEALRDWLPNVINAVEPFVSEEDIDKGAIGAEVIAQQLHDSTFGIVCLTRDNQTRPWINYEAGALSKVVGDNEARVATVLIDIESPAGVTGPLSAFQATRLRDLTDMKQLVRSIAKVAKDTRSKEALDRLVDLVWESFASQVAEERLVVSGEVSAVPARKPEDMLDELLTLMRQVSQDVSRLGARSVTAARSTIWAIHDPTVESVERASAAIFKEFDVAGIPYEGMQLINRPLHSPNLQLLLQNPLPPEVENRIRQISTDFSIALEIRDWGKEGGEAMVVNRS